MPYTCLHLASDIGAACVSAPSPIIQNLHTGARMLLFVSNLSSHSNHVLQHTWLSFLKHARARSHLRQLHDSLSVGLLIGWLNVFFINACSCGVCTLLHLRTYSAGLSYSLTFSLINGGDCSFRLKIEKSASKWVLYGLVFCTIVKLLLTRKWIF